MPRAARLATCALVLAAAGGGAALSWAQEAAPPPPTLEHRVFTSSGGARSDTWTADDGRRRSVDRFDGAVQAEMATRGRVVRTWNARDGRLRTSTMDRDPPVDTAATRMRLWQRAIARGRVVQTGVRTYRGQRVRVLDARNIADGGERAPGERIPDRAVSFVTVDGWWDLRTVVYRRGEVFAVQETHVERVPFDERLLQLRAGR